MLKAVSNSAALPNTWRDTPFRYGLVSRSFHWLTALLVLTQFFVVAMWRVLGETSVTLMLSRLAPHGAIGLLLMVITLGRLLWWYSQRHQRPQPPKTLRGQLARIVHGAFYALLMLIASLGLIRQYAGGWPLKAYGWELIPGAENDIPALMLPADLLHSPLSWLLLLLVAGHIVMAIIGGRSRKISK
ncbi:MULTISPECIES: cytochrome b/b6 domain-containing protein [unclassified Halomonas]|uniref:cytochrome b n=1 Tax=Halomonadaceae TaxID=28256 RepID=UPI001EF5C63C|nr:MULTISPECIES: cytochrome b/b6 domain-containing protein [unclassified Halomonas]MCG7577082.1 cytochrome b/b6 domain-containing protein [Halomonas sp. MMH1-48]MCG7604106.1 cytochrome b/b6 domain-containing protein [Halomonas sp. MM17-34]MCG7613356.1 cytochrome b/b6 domain-containing protein [Halomonas sp. MM17-29]MCG7620170.1 cytochrome b/b6 domain-containing protein [Halomonas sp. DSH1-27]